MTASLKAVLVAYAGRGIPDWWEPRLGEKGIEFKAVNCWTKEDLVEHAADADIVMDASPRRLLSAENIEVLDACRAIVVFGSGVDRIDVKAATQKGIVVANTPACMTECMSDGTISLLFSVVKQVPVLDRAVKAGRWGERPPSFVPVRGYRSATLGLVGLGRIGQAVARKLSGFDMNILAYDPYVDARTMEQLDVRGVGLVELLRRCDFVCLTCPLTEETYHLIGEQELRLMSPKAILINTGRGPVIDEKALCRALSEGWIARAGLDVTEKEPIDPDNPLLELDNVVITAHSVGNSDMPMEAYWWEVDEIVDALARGRWPKSVVNRQMVVPRWNLV